MPIVVTGDSTVRIAEPEDLADVLNRDLTESEGLRAQRRLDVAQGMLEERVADLLVRVLLPTSDPQRINPVIASEVIATIVARNMGNPDGAQSWQEVDGPFSTSRNYGAGGGGSYGLEITDADVARLLGESGADQVSVGSIRLGVPSPPVYARRRPW